MKKTTYILFAALGVATIGSFLLPLGLLKEEGKMAGDLGLALTSEGKENSEAAQPFERISVNLNLDTSGGNVYAEISNVSDTYVEVIESDSATSPRVLMDTSWEHNLTWSVSDSTLEIHVTMEGLLKRKVNSEIRHVSYFIDNENTRICTVIVPRGSLRQMLADRESIMLRDFSKAEIFVNKGYAELVTVNSSFTSLTVK